MQNQHQSSDLTFQIHIFIYIKKYKIPTTICAPFPSLPTFTLIGSPILFSNSLRSEVDFDSVFEIENGASSC